MDKTFRNSNLDLLRKLSEGKTSIKSLKEQLDDKPLKIVINGKANASPYHINNISVGPEEFIGEYQKQLFKYGNKGAKTSFV